MEADNTNETLVDRCISIPALEHWLCAFLKRRVRVLEIQPIPGGRSNLTFAFNTDDGHHWVLRRPPLSQVLPTAHNMARESGIISALSESNVPVPSVVGHCDDTSIAGAPFFVMEYVEGRVLRTVSDMDSMGSNARKQTGLSLARTLAHVHMLDFGRYGLGLLSREHHYIERQLARWYSQYLRTQTHDIAEIEDAYAALKRTVPVQVGSALIHGDYRLDNVIVSSQGEIRAVLDWELSTLGDPLADVGQMILRTEYESSGTGTADLRPLSNAAGYPSTDEILTTYADARGIGVPDVNYYVALAAWKSACILQGVYYRQISGAMDGAANDEAALLTVIRQRSKEALARMHR